jgi:hypothetical protein
MTYDQLLFMEGSKTKWMIMEKSSFETYYSDEDKKILLSS